MRPVIAFTFANSLEGHLPLLKEESSALNWTLSTLHDKGAIEVYREESASVDEIAKIFNRFAHRINIFHYAGHAGAHGLELEKGEGNADGLAELFQQQKENLQLVFLNGCSTLPQVEHLMDLGIKAVIATSVPVEDTKAKEFAGWFYQAMSVKRNIKESYEFAVASLNTKYEFEDTQGDTIQYRRAFNRNKVKKDKMPWGLYVNEEHKDVLEWKLPATPMPLQDFQKADDFHVNDYLYSILESMIEFKPEIENGLTTHEGEEPDEREYLDMIIKNFPWTIGAQLQKLVAFSESTGVPGRMRLEHMVSTYTIASQLLLYILVSQLWDEIEEIGVKKGFKKDAALEILRLTQTNYYLFDHLGYFKQLYPYLGKNKPFVTELEGIYKELKNTLGDFNRSYLFLEAVSDQMYDQGMSDMEAAQMCEEAEYHLAFFLSNLAFLVNYQMIAVRDIKIVNYRHRPLEFKHSLGELNAYAESRLGIHRDPRVLENFTHCNSVLLVKDLREANEYLSLSPFIIDKNTFLDNSRNALNIFIYGYYDKEADEYFYQNVSSNIFNHEQNSARAVHTGFKIEKEIKRGIRFKRKGVEGTKKTETILPYSLLKEQFDHMVSTFSA